MNKVKLTIDNIEVEVDEGTTILNAARQIGGNIVPPAMCYYSSLKGNILYEKQNDGNGFFGNSNTDFNIFFS